jgi:hypothetical protein
MRCFPVTCKQRRSGSALITVMIMGTVALVILAAVLSWQSGNTRLTHRAIQYDRSVMAAEGATEKVIAQITLDFLNGSESLVVNNLNSYRTATVPSASDSTYWNNWNFDDGAGNLGQTSVQRLGSSAGYVTLDPAYGGLKALVSTYTIVSHASDLASVQTVNPGVYQQVQLATIPVFQFLMYSSGDMEISCGQPFDITGRVHANGILYVEPDNAMTFESSVTAVVSNIFNRNPLDARGAPAGSVLYVHPELKLSPVGALNLPIGTNNTPAAVREIIEPPPTGESASSQLGRLRYYNQCDMLVTVSNWAVRVTSGNFNGFATVVPPSQAQGFISTNASFYDWREGKTVLPIDLDLGQMITWSQTNSNLRLTLVGSNLNSVYVLDRRTLNGSYLGAVRVYNGKQLPTNGLTIATGQPLYVWGDYNELNDAYLGTTNTSATRPASLAADAITILSGAWNDSNSLMLLTHRNASPTTVNAAFLSGEVGTTLGFYGGGMENFPRFLETWGSTPFTYNGSMVNMFPSLYSTNTWGHTNVYKPPVRNWTFDVNFDDPTKLPPKTPAVQKVIRNQWTTVAPGINTPPAIP